MKITKSHRVDKELDKSFKKALSVLSKKEHKKITATDIFIEAMKKTIKKARI